MRRSSTSSNVKPIRLASPAAVSRTRRRYSGAAGTTRRTSPPVMPSYPESTSLSVTNSDISLLDRDPLFRAPQRDGTRSDLEIFTLDHASPIVGIPAWEFLAPGFG